MSDHDLRRGQTVTVNYPDSERRESKEAVVKKVPPFTEHIAGEEREVTDKVLVQYPGTSIDGGNLFGDMQEQIAIENIEP